LAGVEVVYQVFKTIKGKTDCGKDDSDGSLNIMTRYESVMVCPKDHALPICEGCRVDHNGRVRKPKSGCPLRAGFRQKNTKFGLLYESGPSETALDDQFTIALEREGWIKGSSARPEYHDPDRVRNDKSDESQY
jgi:hypothetical protein